MNNPNTNSEIVLYCEVAATVLNKATQTAVMCVKFMT